LASSGILLKNVLAHLKSGLLVVDREGRAIVLNRAAEAILHLPPLPAAGRPCAELLSDHPYLAELISASLCQSTLPDRAELEIPEGRGRPKKVIGYTISPVRTGKQALIGVALFFKDLTAVEQEENKSVLQDRLATMGRMAAWMAHEIRNPLAAIGVNAGLLARDEKDRQRLELAGEILHEVRHLNGIITQALDFVRSRPLNLRQTDLGALLREVVDPLAAQADGICVRWSLGRMGPALLDETQLRNAIANLAKNSCEAMAGGGELRVRTRLVPNRAGRGVPEAFSSQVARGERDIRIEIEDTGPGMPREVLDKVFTPFFTTKAGGTGLGMSIAQKAVTDHRGFLDIDSRPGKGTRFTITLPLYRYRDEKEGAVGQDPGR
jgi:signal transduction histidine kinase